jgi:hypothetical protein
MHQSIKTKTNQQHQNSMASNKFMQHLQHGNNRALAFDQKQQMNSSI